MSVRVVTRIRPLLKSERELDVIVRTGSSSPLPTSGLESFANKGDKKGSQDKATLKDRDTSVRIPNPKNENEEYAFQFNAVYDADVTQQELFDAEVSPTVKHLFNGFDITIFAYGVTGTGKTHTMRGGKSLAERGVIPRLLSGIYRRSRKIEKDSEGRTTAKVSLSYYEIYNDKVFDLFEPPEKRTLAGLPLRDNGGRTVVVGLTERPCTNLKEFESLYDQANMHRSTSATKLNAHSSRSHAILCVKVTITSGDKTRVSTASAIDLAGSEDNRRTDNDKERMVESASINKSLFVLAQCVEAISKKQQRIPYRESKMTRILSLGQNNGLTVMILNLAPVRSYHLDTLSSLNFANRTKKIEVREVENEPMFRGPARPITRPSVASSVPRQPLRPLTASVNANLTASKRDPSKPGDNTKPVKAFSVYSDKPQPTRLRKLEGPMRSSLTSGIPGISQSRQMSTSRQDGLQLHPPRTHADISASRIEELVEKKVEEILAARAISEQSRHVRARDINEQMQRRLELLEQRIEGTEDARAEGLSYLLTAKQYQARGDDAVALRMYRLALPFFPHNEKLVSKIALLEERTSDATSRMQQDSATLSATATVQKNPETATYSHRNQDKARSKRQAEDSDADYEENEDAERPLSDEDEPSHPRIVRKKRARAKHNDPSDSISSINSDDLEQLNSPRTMQLLSIINSRDTSQIKLLKGVGARRAEAIVDRLCEMDQELDNTDASSTAAGDESRKFQVNSLSELSKLKGVGIKTVQNMRNGVLV